MLGWQIFKKCKWSAHQRITHCEKFKIDNLKMDCFMPRGIFLCSCEFKVEEKIQSPRSTATAWLWNLFAKRFYFQWFYFGSLQWIPPATTVCFSSCSRCTHKNKSLLSSFSCPFFVTKTIKIFNLKTVKFLRCINPSTSFVNSRNRYRRQRSGVVHTSRPTFSDKRRQSHQQRGNGRWRRWAWQSHLPEAHRQQFVRRRSIFLRGKWPILTAIINDQCGLLC